MAIQRVGRGCIADDDHKPVQAVDVQRHIAVLIAGHVLHDAASRQLLIFTDGDHLAKIRFSALTHHQHRGEQRQFYDTGRQKLFVLVIAKGFSCHKILVIKSDLAVHGFEFLQNSFL